MQSAALVGGQDRQIRLVFRISPEREVPGNMMTSALCLLLRDFGSGYDWLVFVVGGWTAAAASAVSLLICACG